MGMTLQDTLDGMETSGVTIEVFGLGYVGFPLAVRLASSGARVRGIDTSHSRISRLKNGQLMDTECDLEKPFAASCNAGTLQLSAEPERETGGKVGVVCVPTPVPTESVLSNVNVDLAVARFLETCQRGDVLVLESSVEVGTTDHVRRLVEGAGYAAGSDFGLAFCPERIDPLNTRWTLENIPRTVYCSDDTTYEIVRRIYSAVNGANLLRVRSPMVAEVTKSFENAFRLVNISLVNELAVLCDHLGINVREVIDAAATKPFGFMPFYPSAGAGGHCIPKDPIFLAESLRKAGGEFRTISNALQVNSNMPGYIADSVDRILSENGLPKKVVVFGMTYKPDTEDMRDSPGFKVAEEFARRKYEDVGVHDPFFKRAMLPKYLIENRMEEARFRVLDGIKPEFSCMCICQHHSGTRQMLQDVYASGAFPLIYDCQNRLRPDKSSGTILRRLGS